MGIQYYSLETCYISPNLNSVNIAYGSNIGLLPRSYGWNYIVCALVNNLHKQP